MLEVCRALALRAAGRCKYCKGQWTVPACSLAHAARPFQPPPVHGPRARDRTLGSQPGWRRRMARDPASSLVRMLRNRAERARMLLESFQGQRPGSHHECRRGMCVHGGAVQLFARPGECPAHLRFLAARTHRLAHRRCPGMEHGARLVLRLGEATRSTTVDHWTSRLVRRLLGTPPLR